MKKTLFYVLLVLIGYFLGNILPARNMLAPQHKLRFTADYVIKAGTVVRQRRPFIRDLVEPIEIDIFKSNPYPQLQIAD